MKLYLIILLICIVTAGCATSGTIRRSIIRTTITDGDTVTEVIEETTEVELPTNPQNDSSFNLTDGQGVTATMPAVYPPPEEDRVIDSITDKSFIAACVCLALAGICFYLRLKMFPLIPSYAPIGLAALGGVFYIAPILLDRYAGYVAIGIVGLVVYCAYGYWHNKRLKEQPSKDKSDV